MRWIVTLVDAGYCLHPLLFEGREALGAHASDHGESHCDENDQDKERFNVCVSRAVLHTYVDRQVFALSCFNHGKSLNHIL